MKLLFAFAATFIATSALAGAFPSVSNGVVSTAPHYQQETFTVQPNANTPDITVPATNAPIQMIVSDVKLQDRGGTSNDPASGR